MISLDDLEVERAAAHARVTTLTQWIRDAIVVRRSAPSDGIATRMGDLIEEAEDAWTEADARETALIGQRDALLWTIAEAATALARLARDELPIHKADEDKLLALLGTHELPADGLDPLDHAYVVAALRAREASRENDEAFAAFVRARAALVDGEKVAQ